MTGAELRDGWEVVIGLEVHAQLATRTKLFCGCANAFGERPNSTICEVCAGQPGSLPVTNPEALRLALRAGLAVGAEIDLESRFDRKNYFYPDLPKGYQITQLDRPLVVGGGLTLASGRRVRFTRIHVEEDAGKAVHEGAHTLVDLNRAGVPLIEAVTEPDLRSAEEAMELLRAYREILRYAEVSDGDMDKGSLRCDVNVSLRRPGEPLRTKVEIKNLNSFRFVGEAIEAEVARQAALYEAGEAPVQETRLFDPERRETRTMRTKEDADDYRYFPEPDLPPFRLTAADVERERAALPELPAARRRRYEAELGLSAYDAEVLTRTRATADYFEEVAALSGSPKDAANWIANEVSGALGERGADSPAELGLAPGALAELLALAAEGLPRPAARRVLAHLIEEGGGSPRAAVDALGLAPLATDELERLCRAELAGRADVAEAVRAGNEKALGALVGPVMKASGGRADPKAVRELLLRAIRESS